MNTQIATEWRSVGIAGWINVEVPVGTDDDRVVDIAIGELYDRPMDFRIQEAEIVE